jgi:hypothetical protein
VDWFRTNMRIIYLLKQNKDKNGFLHFTFLSKTCNKMTSQFSNFIFFIYVHNKICHISITVSYLSTQDQWFLQRNSRNKDLSPLKTNKLVTQLKLPMDFNWNITGIKRTDNSLCNYQLSWLKVWSSIRKIQYLPSIRYQIMQCIWGIINLKIDLSVDYPNWGFLWLSSVLIENWWENIFTQTSFKILPNSVFLCHLMLCNLCHRQGIVKHTKKSSIRYIFQIWMEN